MKMSPMPVVRDPPGQPLLIWDGECGFCARWVRRLQHLTGKRMIYVPYQDLRGRFAEVGEGAFSEAVHLIDPDGSVYRGAGAAFLALSKAGGAWALGWRCYRGCGIFRRMSEGIYRWVARNRHWLSRYTP
ncbi:MAG: thiol-disulfide oxidoreductase DCC family protein [Puniceicoccales bacterium]